MHRIRWVLSCAALLVIVGASPFAQYDLRQREGMRTTDDPRRVPLPPRDASRDPVVVLRGATLIDGTDAAPVPDAVLVVQGNRIVAAGPAARVAIPAKADRVVDLRGLHLVPGLIDLHVHFSQQRGEDHRMYRDSDAAMTIRGVLLLKQLVDAGITAVREVGSQNDVPFRLKEAVARGMIAGPRVFAAGNVIATRGGHTDAITATGSGAPRPLQADDRVRVANGPWDWRLAVREQIRMGADLLKVTSPYTREEVAAAIDEAHMHGLKVAADAFGGFITWAAEAGLDSLEHTLSVPDDALAVMAKKGTSLVPTLVAFDNVLRQGYPTAGIPAGFFFTPSRRFHQNHELNLETVRKARALGIRVGVGTDVPFENEKRYPEDYYRELALLKQAGYSDREVLLAATRESAEILDMHDKLGTIEAGKLADLIAVSGNPFADIQNLRNARFVMVDGRIVRAPSAGAATSDSTASR